MNLTHILLLAVVQGIAEFLPISSSGHLVIVDALLGSTSEIVDVNIVLHAGTLASILVFYWHQVWRLLGKDAVTIPRLVVGTVPVVVIGLLAKQYLGEWMSNPMLAGWMLLVTAAILFLAARTEPAFGTYQELGYGRCLGIGFAQAFAVLPGISRSGTTISAGMAAGLTRSDAATFSFLLAIPAIGGASLLELRDLVSEASYATPASILAVGALTSFGVGLFSLWWLIRWLQNGRLERFSYWCLLVGVTVIVWQLTS